MIVVVDCGSHLVSNIYKYLDKIKIDYQILHLRQNNPLEIFTQLQQLKPNGIIISGSGDHIYDGGRTLPIEFKQWLIDTKTPTLGICYGHQMLGSLFGGEVISNPKGLEKFKCDLVVEKSGYPLFKDLPDRFSVFMFHFDIISSLPNDFQNFGSTNKTDYAAIQLFNNNKEPFPVFGVQFHPENSPISTKKRVFNNFLAICGIDVQ